MSRRLLGIALFLIANAAWSVSCHAQEPTPFDTPDPPPDPAVVFAQESAPPPAAPALADYRNPAERYPFAGPDADLLRRVKDLPLPIGYQRVPSPAGFPSWVQEFPLFPKGTPVKNDYGSAILDPPAKPLAVTVLPVPSNAAQCADMALLLWAYHRWIEGKSNTLRFKSVSGQWMDFSAYASGTRYRASADGRKLETYPCPSCQGKSGTEALFLDFMKTVFLYAGSASLSRDFPAIAPELVSAGDLFVQPPPSGGGTGHVSVVMDTAQDTEGRKVYRMAYGYIPAMSLFLVTPERGQGVDGWFTREGFEDHVRSFGPGTWRRFPANSTDAH